MLKVQKTPSREKLIEAAIEVFSQKGFEGASTRDIAAASGVNHAAISYYFSGKEALYAACLDAIVAIGRADMGEMAERLHAGTAKRALDIDECDALLDLFIETMMRFFMSCRQRIAPSRIVLRELIDPTPGFNRLYDGMMRDLHESLTRVIGCLAGLNPRSRRAIICAHAVMGQLTVFQNCRAVIERRLDIEDYTERDIRDIIAVIKINTRGVIAAWRARNERAGS